MLNYKIEKILFLIFWLGVIILLAFLIPPPQHVTFIIRYQYICGSLLIAFLVWKIYKKIINGYINAKYEKMIRYSSFDECIVFLDNCIKNNPKSKRLKLKKLFVLAISGKIVGYEMYCEEIKNLKLNSKEKEFVDGLSGILSYFKGMNRITNECIVKDFHNPIEQMSYLIAFEGEIEESTAIQYAKTVYNLPYYLYKAFSSLYLWKIYKKNGDKINEHLYINEALKYCPSEELLSAVKMQVEQT